MKKIYLIPQIQETTLTLQTGVMSTPPIVPGNPNGEGDTSAPARKLYV